MIQFMVISETLMKFPGIVIQRLEHYFLTYKDMPGQDSNTEIAATYDYEEAYEVIKRSMEDYNLKVSTTWENYFHSKLFIIM